MMSQVPVKLQLYEEVRRITVPQNIPFAELIELIKSLFIGVTQSDWENLSLKYVDNEDDVCSITGELELREAFIAKKQEVLRIELSFKKQPQQIKIDVSPVVNTIFENLCGFPQQFQQQFQQQQPFQQQPRKCWQERINQKKMQLIGFHEQAVALMDQKKYVEAKELFSKQVELLKCPWKKSVPLYNIACCEALLGNIDSALAFLSQAVNSGYRNVQHIEKDEDLANLRGLDAFELLLTELRSQPERPKRECRWKARMEKRKQQENNEEIKPSTKSEDVEVKPVVEVPEIKSESPYVPEVKSETPVVEVPEVKSETPVVEKPEIQETPYVPVGLYSVEELQQQQQQQQEQPPQEKIWADYHHQMVSLLQMGFTNTKKNMKALRRTNGDLSQAVVLLLR